MKRNDQSNRLRFDKTLSSEKRVETGSYYTPPQMAELMVCLALSTWLFRQVGLLSSSDYFDLLNPSSDQRKEQLLKKMTVAHRNKLHEAFKNIVVLDLAAGSGIFPLIYMKVLARWFETFGLWEAELIATVASKLHVIDIQQEPLLIYAEEMASRYLIKPENLSIYCLDALDERAIQQEEKLAQALGQGVDLVLGNPPYLGEKNHKELFQKMRETEFGARYYEGRMDYFYYFIYKSLEVLKPGGQLCFITTNYFATADGARSLRTYLREAGHFNQLINFNDCALFKDALGQHNVVFVYEKKGLAHSQPCRLGYPAKKTAQLEKLFQAISENTPNEQWVMGEVADTAIFDYKGMLKLIPSEGHQHILKKLRHDDKKQLRNTLGESFYVQQGIVSGFDRDFKQNQGVFVLTDEEVASKPWLKPYLKPFYKNKQIRKYKVTKPTIYEILYLSEKVEALEQEQGQVYEHLAPHRERLALRREVIKNIRPWYALQWPRESWRFEGPLIAAPQRAFVNVFAYEPKELYGSADIYYIADRNRDEQVTLRTLWMTAYLNSPIVYFWLSLMGKRKGSMLELYATPLKSIPIVEYHSDNPQHQLLVERVEALITGKDSQSMSDQAREAVLSKFHCVFYEAFQLSVSEVEHIEAYYKTSGAAAYEKSYW